MQMSTCKCAFGYANQCHFSFVKLFNKIFDINSNRNGIELF